MHAHRCHVFALEMQAKEAKGQAAAARQRLLTGDLARAAAEAKTEGLTARVAELANELRDTQKQVGIPAEHHSG